MSKFGKPITVAIATDQVKEYLRIRDHEETQKAFASIPTQKIREYYMDQELSFIFEKDLLTRFLSVDNCNGIRVYYAAHTKSESETTVLNEKDLEEDPGLGAPTLVMIPCHINDAETEVINILPPDEVTPGACEHPGFVRYKGNPEDFDFVTDIYQS
jgi:hypothetical protein